jgi:hypothetical protein
MLSIGDNCVFFAGVRIYSETEIGNNCTFIQEQLLVLMVLVLLLMKMERMSKSSSNWKCNYRR